MVAIPGQMGASLGLVEAVQCQVEATVAWQNLPILAALPLLGLAALATSPAASLAAFLEVDLGVPEVEKHG